MVLNPKNESLEIRGLEKVLKLNPHREVDP